MKSLEWKRNKELTRKWLKWPAPPCRIRRKECGLRWMSWRPSAKTIRWREKRRRTIRKCYWPRWQSFLDWRQFFCPWLWRFKSSIITKRKIIQFFFVFLHTKRFGNGDRFKDRDQWTDVQCRSEISTNVDKRVGRVSVFEWENQSERWKSGRNFTYNFAIPFNVFLLFLLVEDTLNWN